MDYGEVFVRFISYGKYSYEVYKFLHPMNIFHYKVMYLLETLYIPGTLTWIAYFTEHVASFPGPLPLRAYLLYATFDPMTWMRERAWKILSREWR